MSKTFGCKRYVFNNLLNTQLQRYKSKEHHLTHFQMNNLLVEWKKEDATFLADVDSQALQQAAKDLSEAYSNFFKAINGKRKGKKVNAPKFKSKYARQSYRTPNNNNVIRINNNKIHLPKLGYVKAIIDREIDGKIKSATISLDKDGRYYVSVLAEVEQELRSMTGREIGIDLGIMDLFITSDGDKFRNPKDLILLTKTKQQIKHLQKKLARKSKGSNNREKARMQLARKYSKYTRQRNDYYHCVSTWLIENYDSIFMEDLNVSGMLKNRKLSRVIQDSAWSTLASMIEYKANWFGKTFYKINRFTPTSKTCSCCNHKLEVLLLNVREWDCPVCRTSHDRDVNAAINIKRVGQVDLYGSTISSSALGEMGRKIPTTLKKFSIKTERSIDKSIVSGGMELVTEVVT